MKRETIIAEMRLSTEARQEREKHGDVDGINTEVIKPISFQAVKKNKLKLSYLSLKCHP